MLYETLRERDHCVSFLICFAILLLTYDNKRKEKVEFMIDFKKLPIFLMIFMLTLIVIPGRKTQAAMLSGKCGPKAAWTYVNGTLTISGSGIMDNYKSKQEVPWRSIAHIIEMVVIKNGITSIGDYSFQDFSKLSNLTLADSLTSIGNYAFNGCSLLSEINVPRTVSNIGAYVFDDTGWLEEQSMYNFNILIAN